MIIACNPPNPNIDEEGQDEFQSLEVTHKINRQEMSYQDTVYVPIYSDIYILMPNIKNPSWRPH